MGAKVGIWGLGFLVYGGASGFVILTKEVSHDMFLCFLVCVYLFA